MLTVGSNGTRDAGPVRPGSEQVMELSKKRVLVTDGAGFLGRHVVRSLQASGCGDIFVPRKAQYDMIHEAAVERLYRNERPEVVIHLAAIVGGIGANQAHPGQFAYENLIMGAMLLEYARQNGVEKFVTIGTICSYPKLAPIPFREENCGMAIPRKLTHRTGWPRRCCSFRGKHTGSSKGQMLFISYL